MNNQEKNLSLDSEEIKQKITDDLEHLYNYPTIGKLFSEEGSDNLKLLRNKLNATKERLDVVIRKGTNEESQKASKALIAISLTLDFLQNLEEKQQIKS